MGVVKEVSRPRWEACFVLFPHGKYLHVLVSYEIHISDQSIY